MHAQLCAHGGEHPGLEVPPLVTLQGLRHSKPAEHARHQGICDCHCFLIREGIRLCPFCEIVYGGEDVAVTPV